MHKTTRTKKIDNTWTTHLTNKTVVTVSHALFEARIFESLEIATCYATKSIDSCYSIVAELEKRVNTPKQKNISNGVGFEVTRVIDRCFLALAYCGKCNARIAEGDFTGAVLAALDAREYAGISFAYVCDIVLFDEGAIRQAAASAFKSHLSRAGSKGAVARLAKDKKGIAMQSVKKSWDGWQKDPGKHKSKAAFARAMLDNNPDLQSQKNIEDACRKWEKQTNKS